MGTDVAKSTKKPRQLILVGNLLSPRQARRLNKQSLRAENCRKSGTIFFCSELGELVELLANGKFWSANPKRIRPPHPRIIIGEIPEDWEEILSAKKTLRRYSNGEIFATPSPSAPQLFGTKLCEHLIHTDGILRHLEETLLQNCPV